MTISLDNQDEKNHQNSLSNVEFLVQSHLLVVVVDLRLPIPQHLAANLVVWLPSDFLTDQLVVFESSLQLGCGSLVTEGGSRQKKKDISLIHFDGFSSKL